jgi:hypothetical protein
VRQSQDSKDVNTEVEGKYGVGNPYQTKTGEDTAE